MLSSAPAKAKPGSSWLGSPAVRLRRLSAEGDAYAVTVDLTYADGSTATQSGRAILYGAGEWRGSLTSADTELRQVLALRADKTMDGRWFHTDQDTIGGRIKAVRADAAPQILSVSPGHLKAGETARYAVDGPHAIRNSTKSAATALLVHVISLDGQPTQAERRKLHSLIESHFGLDRGTADRLVADAGRLGADVARARAEAAATAVRVVLRMGCPYVLCEPGGADRPAGVWGGWFTRPRVVRGCRPAR